MKIVTKQISVVISEEEQNSLFRLADKVASTYVCDLIRCSDCASEICDKDTCPFHNLDDELRNVMRKIKEAAREYGPKN